MNTLRLRLVTVLAVLFGLGVTNAAMAGLGDDLRYGLQLYGVRFGKEYDPLSKGYTLNVSIVNPDTGLPYYNNTHFYLGFGDLVMESGTLAVNATYTERLVPAARFAISTRGVPLDYRYESYLGAQDVVIDGSLLMNVDTYVNQWGFYDITLQASNRATATSKDGVLDDLSARLNYDIGPINLSGNIWLDAAALLTDPFFDQFGMNNPFAAFDEGLAGINLPGGRIEEFIGRLQSGQLLNDDELAQMINNSLLASLLNKEPSSDLFSKVIIPDGLLDSDCPACDKKPQDRVLSMAIPEPGMLALLAATGAGFYVFPRRRSKR
ncbi:MAG: hypothetical protein GX616_17560 [Planctomycetes bacterium]|nr:hypothetical protein [Planctomycetota bacterium]